ncbi:MAG: lipopolysaccharide biosynthesis protein, partial [Tepidisphaeraceae bacterium]
IVLAGSFVLGGLTAQHQALLRRQMKFSLLATIDVAAMGLGIAVGLLAAWFKLGYWSLVLLITMQVASNMVMVWIASPWTPSLPSRGSGLRSMLKFGGALTGFNVVNYFTRNADNMLVGWYWGAGALGLYGKAYQLLLLPLNQVAQPVSNVVLPALSRLQDDPIRYRRYYQMAMLPLALLILPTVVFMAVDARPVVRVLLGTKWMDAAILFQLLAPAALVGGLNVATGWVYQSLGRTDRQLRWGLFSSAVTVIGFAVALRFGVAAVAVTFSTIVCLLRYPSIVYCFRGTPLRPRDLFSVMWRPFVAAAVAGVGTFLAQREFDRHHAFAELVVDGLIFTGLYAVTWMLLPGGRQVLAGLAKLSSELRSEKSGAPAEAGAENENNENNNPDPNQLA